MQDKTCPICGTELSGDFCAFCGYEASADYLNFRTLRPTSRNDHFDLWVWTARSGLYNGERVLFPAEGERFFFPDLALPLLVEHDHETGALLNEAPRFEDERSYLRFFAGKSGKQEDARMKRMLLHTQRTTANRIAAGQTFTCGLKADRTVIRAGSLSSVPDWEDIVAVAAGTHHTIGLRADGSVVAAGQNRNGQCEVASWEAIVAVACGSNHTVGLKADGTVVAVGWNRDGQCNVSDWNDVVAIAAGTYHTLGLKADGTVVATGWNQDGQCNVSGWKDVVAIAAGKYHTVGLKADGSLVATGDDVYGQCRVYSWKLF